MITVGVILIAAALLAVLVIGLIEGHARLERLQRDLDRWQPPAKHNRSNTP